MSATAATLSNAGFTTSPLASGELLISGYLTKWDELDREQDRMIRGSFAAAIPAFLSTHPILCLNHSVKSVIGRVLDLKEDATGVKLTAKVMKQPESSPLRWVYDAIRGRYIAGLSVGAIFTRTPRGDGSNDIVGVDIVECSVASQPQLASAGFEVVSEGKALEWWTLDDERHELEQRFVAAASRQLDLAELRLDVAAMRLR